jgi:hypothetical protein
MVGAAPDSAIRPDAVAHGLLRMLDVERHEMHGRRIAEPTPADAVAVQ